MKHLRAFGVFLSIIVIYLGLPWLGWSVLNSQPFNFFGHLPIVGYAVVVSLFSAAAGIQADSSLAGIQDGPGVKTNPPAPRYDRHIISGAAAYHPLYPAVMCRTQPG